MNMEIIDLPLKGLKLFKPSVYRDSRGFFLETYRVENFLKEGFSVDFVQDNHSFSMKNCLRGMHFQEGNTQDKMVFVVEGKVFDVAVDIRPNSPTYGKWEGVILDGEHHHQLFIPRGFAHGFCVLSEKAHVYYKVSRYYKASQEKGFRWNDPDINIKWPISNPKLSKKDKIAPFFKELQL